MNCGGITSDGGKKMSRSGWTKLALWYKKNKNTYELQLEKAYIRLQWFVIDASHHVHMRSTQVQM